MGFIRVIYFYNLLINLLYVIVNRKLILLLILLKNIEINIYYFVNQIHY